MSSSSRISVFSSLVSEIVRERSESVSSRSTFAQQSVEHVISFSNPVVSSFQSVIFSSSSSELSPLSIRASEIVCKHQESAFFTISASFASVTFASDFLSFSPVLCDHVPENHFMTQDLKTLYSMHLNENVKTLKCNWYVQIKKAQKIYHLRKHEMQMKNKVKQKAKKLLKQQEETRLIKKRAEKYTCRRYKNSTKFDSNIKLHEHIRTRHAKKPKSIVSSFTSSQSIIFSSSVSSFQSIISSFSMSSKLIVESSATLIFEEFSPEFLSVETSKKSIFWAEIASRSIVAFKLSRLPIATPKSMCKPMEKPAVTCPPASLTPLRTPTSKHQGIQKPYLTVNDLFRMFAGKPSPFGLQRHQMRSFSPRGPGKCSPASKCGPIQSRITSYFHAATSPASKSAKSEASGPTHARGSVPRQFSVSRWPSASPTSFPSRFASVRPSFSAFSRPPPVCRHCQGRSATYRPTGWAMPSASRVENNEIPMGMRYWRFAPLHPALGEYWLLLGGVTTLEKLACCLFCSPALPINRWSAWGD